MSTDWPQRIICMTEETVRKEKPKVSAFTSAKIPKILELEPDLVLGFSDLQADIAAELIKNGVEVYIFNHRTVDGILRMIRTLGRLVNSAQAADQLASSYETKIRQIQSETSQWERRPRVYFEEWFEPIISGIGWVSDLIEIVGGIDCYAENAKHQGGKDRIIADPLEVVAKEPDIIIGSWCGRRFHPEKVGEREGWSDVPAVSDNEVYEVKSAVILQPGPAALSEGLDQLFAITKNWQAKKGSVYT